MTTKSLERKVDILSQELMRLRSLVISVIKEEKDLEGEYRPEFIRLMRKAMKEKAVYKYEGPGSLLRQLKQLK